MDDNISFELPKDQIQSEVNKYVSGTYSSKKFSDKVTEIVRDLNIVPDLTVTGIKYAYLIDTNSGLTGINADSKKLVDYIINTYKVTLDPSLIEYYDINDSNQMNKLTENSIKNMVIVISGLSSTTLNKVMNDYGFASNAHILQISVTSTISDVSYNMPSIIRLIPNNILFGTILSKIIYNRHSKGQINNVVAIVENTDRYMSNYYMTFSSAYENIRKSHPQLPELLRFLDTVDPVNLPTNGTTLFIVMTNNAIRKSITLFDGRPARSTQVIFVDNEDNNVPRNQDELDKLQSWYAHILMAKTLDERNQIYDKLLASGLPNIKRRFVTLLQALQLTSQIKLPYSTQNVRHLLSMQFDTFGDLCNVGFELLYYDKVGESASLINYEFYSSNVTQTGLNLSFVYGNADDLQIDRVQEESTEETVHLTGGMTINPLHVSW